MKHFFLISSILLCFLGRTSAQNTFIRDSLDSYVNKAMKLWQIPGVAVAVVKDGKVVVAKGYGVRETGKPGNVDENTLFMIASNTKAFTATSISLLAYQHRLSLDDKVTKWMPSFRLYDSLATLQVTLRDLMCHRLGLETFQGDFLNWGSNLSREEIIRKLRTDKPLYGFRSQFGYCNAAFLTAGQMIPIVTDTTWDDFVKDHFFIPLQMTHTSANIAAIKNDNNAAKPYTLVDNKLVEIPYTGIDNLAPAAAINSSVKDLSNWLLMQLDSGRFNHQQIVPFDVLQQTRIGQTIVNGSDSRLFDSHFTLYGLGWFMQDYDGKKIIWHDGGANGFVTTVCFLPEEKLGIIVLTNTDENDFYEALRYQIIDAYLGLPYRNYSNLFYSFFDANQKEEQQQIQQSRALVAKKLPPSLDLKSYTGTYTNSVYGIITIKLEEGKLNIYFEHHPGLIGHLEPQQENTFLCTYSDPEYGVKTIPFKVENNRATSVTITINGYIDFLPYEFVKS